MVLLVRQAEAQPSADSAVAARIIREAMERSHVMEHAFVLTDVYGPRLTGTPSFRQAGEWAVKRLREMDLANVRQERIDWGRGWLASRFSIRLLDPEPALLIGAPGVWSSSTDGEVVGEPILAPAATDVTRDSYDDFVRRFHGQLRGKFVLMSPPRAVAPPSNAAFRRFSDEDLAKMAQTRPSPRPAPFPDSLVRSFRTWGLKLNQFWSDEGVAGLIFQSRGDGGMVVSFGPDWARDTDAKLPPTVHLAAEHYARIVRLLERGIRVRLALALTARTVREPAAAFNVIAELRGVTRPNEVVMIGAHLDSWPGGTGATDDAAGCAIAIEAMRALVASGVRPARTIRLALWGGHEGGGHLGSVTYIRRHVDTTAAQSAEREQLTLYVNLDNGGGKVRGIYWPVRDEAAAPLVRGWFAPVAAIGATTVVPIAEPQGSDHESFYAAGVPTGMFVQDPLDYATRTRHSNMDLFDRLQRDDMRQAAAAVAVFLYEAASSDAQVPRVKPTNER